jgi:glutamate/tyrosine decarboxylase-like PLP-dependent enzyme
MANGWSEDEIRRVGYLVVDLIAEHLSALPDKPVFRPVPKDLVERFLASPPPAAGSSPDAILREFRDTVAPYPFGNGHPRFWGWVNSTPAVMGIFADALAAAMNPSCAGGNHAAIYLERQVIGWLREMLGFPDEAMGLLVSGGSMATLTALSVARHVKCGVDVRTAGLRGAPQPFRFYQSPEGHSCVRKAVELLGFGSNAIRTVPADSNYRMDPGALDRTIAEDVAAGIRPIAVVASAGTVNTGAIDPIEEIAFVCARHRVWLHIDAAYGGPAILTDEYVSRLAPIARADSVALDPHKWMYVPVEAGFVMVRDADAMRSAFSLVPPYIRAHGSASEVMGLPWFSEYGFQQTRGFRALKVWMTMKQFGRAGHKEAIAGNLALAGYLAERVRNEPDFELMAPPSLSIVCFRYVPTDSRERDEDAIGRLNRALLDRLQLGGEAFLTSTELGGRFVLRACIVNYRSTTEDVDRMLAAVRGIAASLTSGSGRSAEPL